MRDMAHMQVTGEKNIGTAPDKAGHHLFRTSNDVVLVETIGQIEWMMRDNHLQFLVVDAAQLVNQLLDLLLAYASALDRQRPRRIDAENCHRVIVILRGQVVCDVLFEFRKGIHEPVEDIVKRHIVIAGNDELRLRKPAEKYSSLFELAAASSLRQIAGNDNQIGTQLTNLFDQTFDNARIGVAEVYV